MKFSEKICTITPNFRFFELLIWAKSMFLLIKKLFFTAKRMLKTTNLSLKSPFLLKIAYNCAKMSEKQIFAILVELKFIFFPGVRTNKIYKFLVVLHPK